MPSPVRYTADEIRAAVNAARSKQELDKARKVLEWLLDSLMESNPDPPYREEDDV